jgi:DNA-binding NarL/FixJ family response regulator
VLERTAVSVLAADPVTHAGITGQLRERPAFSVLPFDPQRPPAVVVVAADVMDRGWQARVREARCDGRSRVVALVTMLDGDGVLASVEAGACVLLRRGEATDDRLAEAVRVAAAGDGSLPTDLLRRLMRDAHQGAAALVGTPSAVSKRELRILRLLADGLSTIEVASEMAYSESTVKGAIHELTTRLGLRNRTHAVAYALRAGLI